MKELKSWKSLFEESDFFYNVLGEMDPLDTLMEDTRETLKIQMLDNTRWRIELAGSPMLRERTAYFRNLADHLNRQLRKWNTRHENAKTNKQKD